MNISPYARPVWLVFEKRLNTRHWWHLFTTKDFNHVYCLIETQGGIMKIDGGLNGLGLSEIECSLQQYLDTYQDTITDVIRVNAMGTARCLRGLYNCVTIAKATAMIRSWSITPKQLHGWLLKNGWNSLKAKNPGC